MTTTLVPLRRLFEIVNGGTPTNEPENWGGEVAWATPTDLAVVDGHAVGPTQRTLTDAGLRSGSRRVPAGSLLMSTRAPVGYVARAAQPMAFNQGCRGLVPRSADLSTRYFKYQLLAHRSDLEAAANGTTFQELSTDALASLRVHVAEPTEQRRVADFLDAETARVDALIAAKQQMIVVAQQRHAAAVAVAIFGDAARSARLAHLVNLLPGFSFQSTDFDRESGVRLLRGINIAPGRLRWDEVVYIRQVDARIAVTYQLLPGDLVIGMDRPMVSGGMRVAEVQTDDLPCLLVQRVARIRTLEPGDRAFVRHALASASFRHYFDPITTGVSVPHISPSQIVDFRLPVPPADTRRAIGRELDRSTAATDAVTDTLSKQIGLLRERRSALITAAVSGELVM